MSSVRCRATVDTSHGARITRIGQAPGVPCARQQRHSIHQVAGSASTAASTDHSCPRLLACPAPRIDRSKSRGCTCLPWCSACTATDNCSAEGTPPAPLRAHRSAVPVCFGVSVIDQVQRVRVPGGNSAHCRCQAGVSLWCTAPALSPQCSRVPPTPCTPPGGQSLGTPRP